MHDIAEFLAGRDPFSGLDEAELERLASRAEVEFFPAGTRILPQGERPQGRIRVIRRGAVELLDRGRPADLLGEGEMVGHPSVLSGMPTRYEARAKEDTLCYSLAAEDVIPLLGRPSSLRFLARSLLARGARSAGNGARAPSPEVALQPAAALVRRPPVIIPPDTTLREAARLMDRHEASSVVVDLGKGEYGIVTDRDLRSRVVAGRLSTDDPVSAAMSTPVFGVDAEQSGADVMLTMIDHDTRHVPVFSPAGEVLGVIVAIDLIAAETSSPFVLRRAIAKARNKRQLQAAAAQLRSTVVSLHRAELAPFQVSEITSAMADALISRVIELAVESAGPPPAEFAWMALGSHGRREPVPSSDVDSGMAWRGAPDPDPISAEPRRTLVSGRTTEYMQGIAAHVADTIRVIGWRLDPHGVTASGAFSASSIEDWGRAIRSWLARPSDNRVLIAASILLDGRVISGPERGLDVKALLFEAGERATLERWMLRLALAAKPPTGFMHDIVVDGSGTRRGTFDIKHGGLMPIVDLARYAALRADARATPTLERLRAATDRGVIEATDARILEEAYELFSALRLEHQVAQIERGGEPDDHLNPKQLDPLTRRYLRDAFREVAAVQRSLSADLAPAR
jgi:CBS domain-containing protein